MILLKYHGLIFLSSGSVFFCHLLFNVIVVSGLLVVADTVSRIFIHAILRR